MLRGAVQRCLDGTLLLLKINTVKCASNCAATAKNGGFPPLMLDPIDFGSLYMQQAEIAAQQESGLATEGNA